MSGVGGGHDVEAEDYKESLTGVSLAVCSPASLGLDASLRNLHYTLPRGAYIVIPHQSPDILGSEFNKPYPDHDCADDSLLFSTKF